MGTKSFSSGRWPCASSLLEGLFGIMQALQNFMQDIFVEGPFPQMMT
jgi:hypothetical protein